MQNANATISAGGERSRAPGVGRGQKPDAAGAAHRVRQDHCLCKITEDEVRSGSRVLILAHRGELLQQAADKLERTSGLKCAVEKAEQTCLGEWYRVTVGSVQTLMRQKRLAQFPPNYFQTIIIDEAHHAISDSYQSILEHFPDANVLGVTATPTGATSRIWAGCLTVWRMNTPCPRPFTRDT